MARILTGTAGWTDPTLLETSWYPGNADNAEERLRYYSSQFSLVEVDSTYYGLPAESNAYLWVERTPPNFTFDFKAFRLFTGHPTPIQSLPKVVREEMPAHAKGKGSIYQKDLPRGMVDEIWEMYRRALDPVAQAGKMGAVFLQFPKWFYFSRDNMDYIAKARRMLPDFRVAVEFRQPSWVSDENRNRTFDFLQDNRISYTCVDAPQGTAASVPPVAASTAPLAVVRFHGRRVDTWDKPNVGVEERFQYLYKEQELQEWVPKIETLSEQTEEVHAIMNNCYADYAVRNAQQLALLLEQQSPVSTAT